MGFFGGRKNKTPNEDADRATQNAAARKSRRVVVPGQKATEANPPTARTTQAGKAPVGRAPAGGTQRVNKPPTQALQRPSAPISRPDTARANQGDAGLTLGASTGVSAAPTPARPKSREPIANSAPLSFAGDLASGSRSGPARTGDNALIEFLVNKAKPPLLNADQAAHARSQANQTGVALDQAAVQLGFISEDQLVSALTQECWVPHLKVDKYEIRKKALDTIAREDAVHFGVFPVDKLGSLLTLAMVNPLDIETIRLLESKTGLDIKKVVATRSEINQGIEKYYSGTVVAKDTSLSFTQDEGTEPKSVTQMLTNVPVAKTEAIQASRPTPSGPLTRVHVDVVPEIQDIDDLLTSDEVIAPAIIEPIGIEAIGPGEPAEIPLGELEPLALSPNEFEEADPFAAADPFAPVSAPVASNGSLDIDLTLEDTAEIAPAKSAAKADRPSAPEFLDDDATSAPAVKPAAPKPAVRPAPVPKAAAPALQIINLMPVMEEEFQHAITHGKAHVFEKWVGLQTRNRIINGVAVEPELGTILASLYASPRR